MTSDMLSKAGEAAKALLSTMLGDNAPLKFSTLQPCDIEELRESVPALLGIYPEDGSFAVLLDPEWLPLIAGLKLGVQTRVGDEHYEEIVRELGGLFVAAVRSHLSAVGEDVSAPSLHVKAPGDEIDDVVFQQTSSRLPFFMEWDGTILHGFVLADTVEIQESESSAETSIEETFADPETTSMSDAPAEPFGASLLGHTPRPESQAPESIRVQSAAFPDLGAESIPESGSGHLGLLAGVELEVTVELGRRRMPLSEILRLTSGSVLELEKLVGEPLQVFANNRLIAEGEAVVIDEQFGVRITALAARGAEKLLR
ncbi:MAG: flagellar motor switch protein FliN/FliY [Rhodothermales bacterium]|jgi:flagellar motor switch protein FliN/FliY